jgi:hypothetical protein
VQDLVRLGISEADIVAAGLRFGREDSICVISVPHRLCQSLPSLKAVILHNLSRLRPHLVLLLHQKP